MRPLARSRATADAARDDGGIAMLTVIMLIMVCAAISVLMLGVVVAQVKPTVFEAKNTRTISAAEAGISAALSQFRSALGAPDPISGAVYGDPRLLPCTVTGTVGGTSTTLRYDVAVTYFTQSPANKDATWRASNAMTCVNGSGVPTAPSFALLTAVGSDSAVGGYAATVGNRTLESVYTFQVINNTVDGGTIYTFGDGFCLQADGQTAGSTISYVPATDCRDDAPSRMWAYGTDYKIHLAVTDLSGTKLCITGAGGVTVTLQDCSQSSLNYKQLFSWEGGARWRGENSSVTNYSSECLGTGDSSLSDLTGYKLKITTNCASDAAWGSFDPDARVGAGPAGFATHQIVNFLEFGRCMDVTNEQVSSTFMISYPCKQDPSGGSLLAWNHKWYYAEPTPRVGSTTTTLSVNNGSVYCLTTSDLATSPAYPTMTPCNTGSPTANQTWTRTAQADTYANSWTFKDRYGRCISLGDKYNGSWSKLLMATCSGGPEQKWNAPPTAQKATLDNFKELN